MIEPSTTPPTPHPLVDIQWRGGLEFDAGRPDGPVVRIDGDAQAGPGPFDLLLCAIASCASTDVVTLLAKQLTPLASLIVNVEATRVAGTPRRIASAVLHFAMRGSNLTQEQAEQAVAVSITQYCSVRASLTDGAVITWTVKVHT